MASLMGRKVLHLCTKGPRNRVLGILAPRIHRVECVAGIVSPASHIPKAEKPAPWPYKLKTFTVFDQFYDSTEARLDENSKVIVVDGNLAVGKTEFAEKLAKNLDFYLLPHLTERDLFYSSYHEVDLRWLNHALPKDYHFYDLRSWLTDPHPENRLGSKLQLLFYYQRVRQYANALHHLMSTGQGVVIERSPFSDQVFAEAMVACGYMSRQGLNYYLEMKRQTIFDFWKPHLTIFLDAPVDHVMKKIHERNHPAEVKSKALNEKFITEIDHAYKKSILPELKRHGEVLVYDATDLDDIQVIVEDIERLNLEWDSANDLKFQKWHDNKPEDLLSYFRRYWGSVIEIDKLFNLPQPWEVPEMMDTPECNHARRVALDTIPRTEYRKGFNPKEVDPFCLMLRT